MKYVDTSTMGGRIRLARQKMGISMDALGYKIGVSTNYVSIIERNTKCPSDDLLGRIADVTGAPINWLKTGMEDDNKQADDSHEIDPSLFLNILMLTNPSITKTTITTILGIDDLELDEILAGRIKYDPAWESGLSALSQQIDNFHSLNEKLDRIRDYLRKEETKKTNSRLIRMFRGYLEEKYDSDFSFNSPTHMPFVRGVALLDFVSLGSPKLFTCKQQNPESNWEIWSFSEAWRDDLKFVLDLVKFNSKPPCENIVLAVNAESAFETLRSADWIEVSPWDESNRPNLFLMHIDTDSMQVVGDMVPVER